MFSVDGRSGLVVVVVLRVGVGGLEGRREASPRLGDSSAFVGGGPGGVS